jgi:hypothetical protein
MERSTQLPDLGLLSGRSSEDKSTVERAGLAVALLVDSVLCVANATDVAGAEVRGSSCGHAQQAATAGLTSRARNALGNCLCRDICLKTTGQRRRPGRRPCGLPCGCRVQ